MTIDPSRREFFRTGAAVLASGIPGSTALGRRPFLDRVEATAEACIFINLVGGPSQLDTWDPKPNAPSDVRGPFGTIPTRVPGLRFTELFPKMAAMADRFSVVRAMHHTAAPIHETGFQLLNSGHLFRDGPEWPSVGAVISALLPERNKCTPWWVLPGAEVQTGTAVSHGQGVGFLRDRAVYTVRPNLQDIEPWRLLDCAYAPIVSGARFVTVNMFPTVFDAVSWDCHADRGSLATTLDDYRDIVGPMFDTAFTELLSRLEECGQLDRTLVVATGEFGRTPNPNSNGGRDHWPGCWTALVAGGGVQGGRVVGTSDAIASAPADRPITPQELVATIFHAFGLPSAATISDSLGIPVPIIDAAPVRELF